MKSCHDTDRHSDPKTDYLMRCFRNTAGKDRENYVVLGIWHRLMLAGIEIRPITQQCVRRPHGGYALLDLYFPAIHLAVECDESYHLKNRAADELREDDILAAFNECLNWSAKKNVVSLAGDEIVDADSVNTSELLIARVDAAIPYQAIDKQLDRIVEIILKRAKQSILPLWDMRTPREFVSANGGLCVTDPVLFGTAAEILNAFKIRKPDGREYRRIWKGSYRLRDKKHTEIWFPHLSYSAGGWENILSSDGEQIDEQRVIGQRKFAAHTRKVVEKTWLPLSNLLKKGIGARRIVFAHSKNRFGEVGYRFKGVFELVDVVFHNGEQEPVRMIWQLKSDTFCKD